MKKAVLYRDTDVEHLLLSDRIVYSTLAFWSIELIDEIHENSGKYRGELKDNELSNYYDSRISLYGASLSELSKATGLTRSTVHNCLTRLVKKDLISPVSIYILTDMFERYSVLIGLPELSPSENVVYSYLCRSAIYFKSDHLMHSINCISQKTWLDFNTVKVAMKGLFHKGKIKRENLGRGKSAIVLCQQADVDKYRDLQTKLRENENNF